MNVRKTLLSIAAGVISVTAVAQVKGDDDGILSQRAAGRDKAAIDTAVNGWWTASMKNHDQRIAWWREARFGCFIHWGVYSVPGGEWKGKEVPGYAEHLMRKEKISRQEYADQLIKHFNPEHFDADAWVKMIRDAGMRYLVITAKHHDGVAMYPTAIGDYSISQSPFKQDPMAALSAACKKYGIRFGFYYSHAFDWEHPDAPGNDWDYDNPGGDKNLHGGGNWYDVHPELLPKAVKYVNEKSIPQIQELLRKYHPDILWFDTPHKLPLSENIRILQAIRAVDTNVVVNGRLARSSGISFGDYKNTADRPAEFYPVTGDWEAIPTTNESYGYSRYDKSHKPPRFFIQLMAKAASRGGNLLMNIGPKGDGSIDNADSLILHGIGSWMKENGESIYGTTASPLPPQPWGVSTRKGNKLYLHVFEWSNPLYVGGLMGKVEKAYLLADKQPLKVTRLNPKDVSIAVGDLASASPDNVIVLEMKDIKTDSVRVLDTRRINNVLLAFDAIQHGKGFSFGDGKKAAYFVQGWKNMDQYLSWKVRITRDAVFSIGIKYATDQPPGNAYEIRIGKNVINAEVKPAKKTEIVTQSLQEIKLPAGEYEITVKPTQISGPELMKLFEITMQPK
ncbi:alpha-L-fucosidase [Chitinophaga qingshengii]|uniref:alpha-L-fucosidase n=1 Tax=Chitinophaga qingshengii TaxID=1569794 RepID=A0ABR7TZI5_9BACT|nr:alpha-L-fucosidase [Chitinophaga qingshengii]MBC9934794.1 alpha-L-fucosidase [Chitinophaga qingshengii]